MLGLLVPGLGMGGGGASLIYGPLSFAAVDVLIPLTEDVADVLIPSMQPDVFANFSVETDVEML